MGILYILGVREQPQVLVLTFHLDFEIVFLGFVVSLLCKESQGLPKASRDSLVSVPHLTMGALGLWMPAPVPSFMWVLGNLNLGPHICTP